MSRDIPVALRGMRRSPAFVFTVMPSLGLAVTRRCLASSMRSGCALRAFPHRERSCVCSPLLRRRTPAGGLSMNTRICAIAVNRSAALAARGRRGTCACPMEARSNGARTCERRVAERLRDDRRKRRSRSGVHAGRRSSRLRTQIDADEGDADDAPMKRMKHR